MYGRIAQRMLSKLDDAFEAMSVQRVTVGVLSYLRRADDRELFEYPVIDQVPEIKEVYLAAITKPMDFRTSK